MHTESFGRWWPSELTYQLANLGSAAGQAALGAASDAPNPIQIDFGIVELAAGLTTGVGMREDGLSQEQLVTLRMLAESFTGLADMYSGQPKFQVPMTIGMIGSRIPLGVLQIVGCPPGAPPRRGAAPAVDRPARGRVPSWA